MNSPRSLLLVLVWSVLVLVVGVGSAWIVARSVSSPAFQQPSEQATDTQHILQDRTRLVRLCVDLHDSLERPALRERVVRALADVGVTAIVPVDAVFDPARDEAVTSVVTDDPGLLGRVASVERPGFRDQDHLLRPAEVVVYVPARTEP